MVDIDVLNSSCESVSTPLNFGNTVFYLIVIVRFVSIDTATGW